MNVMTQAPKADPMQVGDFIERSDRVELIDQFKFYHPDQLPSVLLNAEILKAVLSDERVSGIRFMYGLHDRNNPASRVLMLMPCNFTMNGNIPNVVFSREGFYTNTGEHISLDEACSLQLNHVLNLKGRYPDTPYTKIVRGYFLGKTKLNKMIERAAGDQLIYHLGYDVLKHRSFKPVIMPANSVWGFDNGELCPDHCNVDDETTTTCIATYVSSIFEINNKEKLDILRGFRNELLADEHYNVAIEKYYTISASIMEGIRKEAEPRLIAEELHRAYFKTAVADLMHNDKAKAFELFETCMQGLIERYLYQ